MKPTTDVVLFVAALLIAAFLFGYAAHRQRWFPAPVIERALAQAGALWARPHHLFPIVHRRSGARVVERTAMAPGLTLLTSYWRELDWRPGIKLIDADGRTLHLWPVDVDAIWPEPDPERGDYVHGTHLFADGDVLFNVEHAGVVRMDACGKPRWRSDIVTHHSISAAADGTFWLSGNRTWRDDDAGRAYLARFPGLRPPLYDGQVFQIQGDGTVLREISMLETLYANGLERYLAKTGRRRKGDLIHLNDVEALSPAQAAEYPSFAAGDIVVSLKFLHLVLVMDPVSGVVKWHDGDSFIEQHDPDFIGAGWIGVYDNNSDFTPRGAMLGGSRILAVRPHTGERRLLFPGARAEPFYTEAGGKWQLLENGNMLLSEARAGRVVEVAADGRTVWDWVNEAHDEKTVPEVLEATRYAFDPATVAAWPCAQSNEAPAAQGGDDDG
jgi:hypothetical protein